MRSAAINSSARATSKRSRQMKAPPINDMANSERTRLADRDTRARAGLIGRMHRRGADVFVDDRLRVGVVHAEIELMRAAAPIEWGDDDAGELARPMDRRRLPAILQHRHEMVASFKSERVEAGNERRNFFVPSAVGETDIAVDDRERAWIARDAGEEARAEIKHRGGLPARSIGEPYRAPRPSRRRSRSER